MQLIENLIKSENKVIDSLQNTLVDASAGTGKTYNICEKVIRRLKLGYDIKEFVIMTYTEKAAGELINRIRNRIKEEIGKDDITNSERTYLNNALTNFDFATICTIHSFCQKIIKEYAFECNLPNDLCLDNSSNNKKIAFIETVLSSMINDNYNKIDNDKIINLFKLGTNDISNYLIDNSEFSDKIIIKNNKKFQNVIDKNKGLDNDFIKKYEEALDIDSFLEKYTENDFPEIKNVSKDIYLYIKQKKQIISLVNKYNELKKKNNFCDFNDLIKIVSNALSNKNLIIELQKKYKVGIIDEFQDTTPMQYYIAKKLFLDRIIPETSLPSHLIIVGDEKQSIYSFQGSNVQTYKEAKSEMTDYYNAYYETLNDNYRTNEDLVNILNEIFSNNKLIENYVKVNPQIKNTTNNPLNIHKYEINKYGEFPNLDSIKENYANVIANTILDLKSKHNLSDNDFCVLFRSKSDAQYISKTFSKKGLKYTYYKKEGLYNSFESNEILLLLKALAYPTEKSYIKSLFATDFFPNLHLENLNNNENIYIEIENKLEKWRNTFKKKNIYYMFEEIFSDTNVFERLITDNNSYENTLYEVKTGERNITNLSQIIKRLNEINLSNLSDYVKAFTTLIETANREENIEELDTEKDTIKIMTMHASKGLEFNNVFIFGGWYRFKSSKPYKIICQKNKEFYFTDNKDPIYEEYRNQAKEEFKRLLYVALTRAKERLFLPYIYEENSEAQVLSNALENIIKNNSLINVNVSNDGHSSPITKSNTLDLYDNIINQYNYDNLKIDEKDVIRNPNFFVENYHNKMRELKSFSSLRKEDIEKINKLGLNLDTKIDKNEEGIKGEFITEDEEDNILGGKEIGNIIHEILEKINFSQVKSIYKIEDFITWLENDTEIKNIIEKTNIKDTQRLGNIIWRTLDTTLPNLKIKIKDIEKCSKEIKFTMTLNNEFNLNGIIDMIFEYNNKIYILDWKTNKTKTGKYNIEDIQNIMDEHYNNQYKIYVESVNKWLKDNNSPIKEVSGIFYIFLRPTEKGNNASIYELIF